MTDKLPPKSPELSPENPLTADIVYNRGRAETTLSPHYVDKFFSEKIDVEEMTEQMKAKIVNAYGIVDSGHEQKIETLFRKIFERFNDLVPSMMTFREEQFEDSVLILQRQLDSEYAGYVISILNELKNYLALIMGNIEGKDAGYLTQKNEKSKYGKFAMNMDSLTQAMVKTGDAYRLRYLPKGKPEAEDSVANKISFLKRAGSPLAGCFVRSDKERKLNIIKSEDEISSSEDIIREELEKSGLMIPEAIDIVKAVIDKNKINQDTSINNSEDLADEVIEQIMKIKLAEEIEKISADEGNVKNSIHYFELLVAYNFIHRRNSIAQSCGALLRTIKNDKYKKNHLDSVEELLSSLLRIITSAEPIILLNTILQHKKGQNAE